MVEGIPGAFRRAGLVVSWGGWEETPQLPKRYGRLQTWNMGSGRSTLVFLLLWALGLKDSHTPTFWLLLWAPMGPDSPLNRTHKGLRGLLENDLLSTPSAAPLAWTPRECRQMVCLYTPMCCNLLRPPIKTLVFIGSLWLYNNKHKKELLLLRR